MADNMVDTMGIPLGYAGLPLDMVERASLIAGTSREQMNFESSDGKTKFREGDSLTIFEYDKARRLMDHETGDVTNLIAIPVNYKGERLMLTVEDKGIMYPKKPVMIEFIDRQTDTKHRIRFDKNCELADLSPENIEKLMNELSAKEAGEAIGLKAMGSVQDVVREHEDGKSLGQYKKVVEHHTKFTGKEFTTADGKVEGKENVNAQRQAKINEATSQYDDPEEKKFLEKYLIDHPDVDPADVMGVRMIDGDSGVKELFSSQKAQNAIKSGEKYMIIRLRGKENSTYGEMINENGENLVVNIRDTVRLKDMADSYCGEEAGTDEITNINKAEKLKVEGGIEEYKGNAPSAFDTYNSKFLETLPDEIVEAMIVEWMTYAINEMDETLARDTNVIDRAIDDPKGVYSQQIQNVANNMQGAKYNGVPVSPTIVEEICERSSVFQENAQEAAKENGLDENKNENQQENLDDYDPRDPVAKRMSGEHNV